MPKPMRYFTYAIIGWLAVTGFGQMPLYNRYYIADIPGLGFLADFSATHYQHMVLSAALLAIAGYLVAANFHRVRLLTTSGQVRAVLFGFVFASGLLRVLKNQPNITFSPAFTVTFDLVHLFGVMALGMAALAFRLTGHSRWFHPAPLQSSPMRSAPAASPHPPGRG